MTLVATKNLENNIENNNDNNNDIDKPKTGKYEECLSYDICDNLLSKEVEEPKGEERDEDLPHVPAQLVTVKRDLARVSLALSHSRLLLRGYEELARSAGSLQ